HEGKYVAVRADRVGAIGLQDVEGQPLAIQAPNLRHAQRGVNAHAVERTAGHIHLNGQVWWWVHTQVDSALAADLRLVRDPPGMIRLQAALPAPPAQRRRAAGLDR